MAGTPKVSARGFSLMELMVAMVIMGLLVGLAWPSYRGHVQRSQRAEAAAALLQAQQFMERIYAVQGRYDTSMGVPVLPAALQAVPAEGVARYRLRLDLSQSGGYVLHAEPQWPHQDAACGGLWLAHTGAQGRTGSGMSVQQCWR